MLGQLRFYLCFLAHLLLCVAVTLDLPSTAEPQVALTSGKFVGTTSIANGTDRWLGIPFAEPPIGNLRFKAPVAISQPSSILQPATSFGNAGPQLPSRTLGAPMSEDCLYLNVSRKSDHMHAHKC